jgi:hypothetical protein
LSQLVLLLPLILLAAKNLPTSRIAGVLACGSSY